MFDNLTYMQRVGKIMIYLCVPDRKLAFYETFYMGTASLHCQINQNVQECTQLENKNLLKCIYRIRPNYRTMRLGFSKLLEKLLRYVPTYIKGTLKKRSAKDLSNYTYSILFLIFFIKAYAVCTHLNCIDKSMQFK